MKRDEGEREREREPRDETSWRVGGDEAGSSTPPESREKKHFFRDLGPCQQFRVIPKKEKDLL